MHTSGQEATPLTISHSMFALAYWALGRGLNIRGVLGIQKKMVEIYNMVIGDFIIW